MQNHLLVFFLSLASLINFSSYSQELVLGEERVEPGIIIIFEGAVKDIVSPENNNLNESLTDIHIEARVNWDTTNIPEGTPESGFIPYLKINALIVNEKTGIKTFVDLLPHINLIDNFHYARNISLPGQTDELYSIEFNIIPPNQYDLALHKDWIENYSNSLFKEVKFIYKNVDFEEIANASRR